MALCVSDYDCPGSKVCFTDLKWMEDGESFCDCDTFWGFVGYDCSGLSFHSGLLIALITGSATTTLLCLAYTIKMVRRVMKMPRRRKERWWWQNTDTSALVSVTMALLGLLGWRIARMWAMLTPTSTMRELPTTPTRTHPAILAEKVAMGMLVFFGMYAALAVSLRWVAVARNGAKLLNVKKSSLWGEHKRKAYAFQVVFILVVLAATFRGSLPLAALLTTPFVVIVGVSFAYALWRLEAILVLMVENFGEPDSATREEERRGFSDNTHSNNTSSDERDGLDEYGEGSEAEADAEADAEEKEDVSDVEMDAGGAPGSGDDHRDGGEDLKVPDTDEEEAEGDPDDSIKSTELGRMMRSLSWVATQKVGQKVGAAKAILRRGGGGSSPALAQRRTAAGNRYVMLLREVRFTAALVLLSTVLLVLSLTLYAIPEVAGSYRETCRPDEISGGAVCWSAVFNDSMAIGMLVLVASVQHYIYAENRRRYLQWSKNKKRGPNRRLRLRPDQLARARLGGKALNRRMPRKLPRAPRSFLKGGRKAGPGLRGGGGAPNTRARGASASMLSFTI